MKLSNHGVIGKRIRTLGQKWARLGSTLGLLLVAGLTIGSPIRQIVVDWQLYIRLQDELLTKTPQGQCYISLYGAHLDEINHLMLADPALLNEGLSVLDLWEPNVRALLDGQGGQAIIRREQVEAVTKVLDDFSAAASPDLRQAISDERARTPLEPLAGLSMDQAYEVLIRYPPDCGVTSAPIPVAAYTLTWLPPFDPEALYMTKVGSTIPVEFTIRDGKGHPVMAAAITLEIHNADGKLIIGPVGIGNDPTRTIVLFGDDIYHYDFQTTGLARGSYGLQVKFDPSYPEYGGGKGIYLSPVYTPSSLKAYTVTWLPPLAPAVPYETEIRPTIPVEFTIYDAQGQPVIDPTVLLLVLRPSDNGVIGGVGVQDYGSGGITLQGATYHYDFATIGMAGGWYLLQVSFDSPDPDWRLGSPVRIFLKPVPLSP